MSTALARTSTRTVLKIIPALDATDLAGFEELLREQREILTADLRGLELDLAGGGDESSSIPNHPAELGSDVAELDVNLGRRGAARAEIREIDAALARLRDGSFGTCEDCGLAIPRERLSALPHARLCIPCKMEEESA